MIEASFSRSGVRIRRAMHAPLPAGLNVRDPAAMGDFLNRALREHRIRAKKAAVDVPRQDVILNLMSLPRGSRDELAAMVHAQVIKELPFSKDQAAIDFAVMPEKEGALCEVWVAAVRTHVLEYYQQTLEAAGLKPERVGLRSYANQAAVVVGGDVEGRTVLVDVGPSMTEISVIRDGRLIYSRAASVTVVAEPASPDEPGPVHGEPAMPAADDFLPRQGPLEALLIEVSRTIQAYRASDAGARIDRIILSGTGGVDEHLRAAFEARFGSPTRIFEAPRSANWTRVTEVSAAPFIATIGQTYAQLAPETERVDFLHPKEPEAERKERAKRRPIAVLTACLFVAAALVLVVQFFSARQKEIDGIKRSRVRVENNLKDYKDLEKKHADLKEWMHKNVVWLDELRLVAEHFVSNQEAYITDLEIDDKGQMVIELASANTMVAPKLAAEFRKITTSQPASAGKHGRTTQEFVAKVGSFRPNPDDPNYPFSDVVTVQVKALEKTR